MRRPLFAGLLILFTATAAHAALSDTKISVRIKNLSAPATYYLTYTRRVGTNVGEDGNMWPNLGYMGKAGLTKDAPAKDQWLGTGEASPWVKLFSFGSVLHIRRQGAKPWRTEVEIKLQGDQGQMLSRKIVWEGDEEQLHVYLYLRPLTYNPDVLCVKTFEELMQENEECVRQALQECPWKKLPQRLAFYSDPGEQESDGPVVIEREFNFLREVGVNGLFACDHPPLRAVMAEKGFSYLWASGYPCDVFTVQDAEKLRKHYDDLAQSLAPPYDKYGVLDKVRGLQIGDELANGKLQDYLNGGETSRAHLAGCLQADGVPPSEFGFKDYSELKLAAADVLKKSNPALYYWANRVRMEAICDQWKLDGEAYDRCFPNSWGSPDWSIFGYETGGYDQWAYDYWMLYRKKALHGTWGETWSGIEFTAFLIDMMRSQARGLPFGVFEIQAGFTPVVEHFRVYGELIHGATDIAWYSYGGPHGVEADPWQIKRDTVREITLMHREAGEAEPYLLDTKLEPAKVALLWTPAQQIWEPGMNHCLTTAHYALTHSNYAFDILSSYDVDDGSLDRYKVLYMPYDYVEKRTWEKIRQWTEKGGSLILESGTPRDEYNRPLSLEDWLPGFQAVSAVKGDHLTIIALGYRNLYEQPLIERTKPVSFPVICSKTVLTAPKDAQVLLSYADGHTAAFSMPIGTGRVTVFGFHAGASYVWDEANREKPPLEQNGVIHMFHSYNAALREVMTAPIGQAGVERVGGITDDMVVARHRVGGGKECVALFDYHFGLPPEQKHVRGWEDVKERRVQVQLTYPAEKARSLRGEILARKGNTVEVAFHGVDMILVDEK